MAPRPLTMLPQRTSSRTGPPSKGRWDKAHPTVGVCMPRAQRDALAARAQAEGTTMGALLRGDLADRDRAIAEACERGRAEAAAEARREGAAALDALRREHALALASAGDSAYRRGQAEAAPNWQDRARRAEAMVVEQENRLHRLRGDHDRELAQARAEEREDVQRAAAAEIREMREELALQFEAAAEAAETQALPLRVEVRRLQQALALAEAAHSRAIQERDAVVSRAAQGDPVRQHLADALAASRRQLAESSARRDFWLAHHRYPSEDELAHWLEVRAGLPLPDRPVVARRG